MDWRQECLNWGNKGRGKNVFFLSKNEKQGEMKLVESFQGQADKFGINLIATGNYNTFLNGKVASLKYSL